MVQELSTYGMKGFEMASHFEGAAEVLRPRLIKILGLNEKKPLIKEQADIMFIDDYPEDDESDESDEGAGIGEVGCGD